MRSVRGFTVVELIVATTILAMVMAVGIQVFIRARGSAESTMAGKLILQSESRSIADRIIAKVREGSDVIRPFLGETRNYLVFRDTVNNTCMIYLITDDANTVRFKRPLYKLVCYTHDYSGGGFKPDQEKILAQSLQRAAFTMIAPDAVQISATIANDKSEYQFVTHVGLLNFGGKQ